MPRIAISDIIIQERFRELSPDHVTLFAAEFAAKGQNTPIQVRTDGEQFFLMAGEHRLAAAASLGWEEIEATIDEGISDTEARLRQIDENLVRYELNALDRSIFLAERKATYEEIHPETRKGVAGGKARQGHTSDTMSFADDVAEKIGLDKRTIQRAVSIAEKIAPDLRKRLSGTVTARNQADLLALTKLEPAAQEKVVTALTREKEPAATVKAARDEVEGRTVSTDPHEAQLKALRQAWNKASAKARKSFISGLREEGEIA